ncbi:MAG: calcium-binding protein [Hyphomicrobium sp.]
MGNVSDATLMEFTVDSKAPTAMKWNAMKAASETDLPSMSAIATLAATDDVTMTDFTYVQSPGNSGFNISENGAVHRNSNAVANNTTTILTAQVQDQAGNAFSKSFAVVTGSSAADKVSGQSYDEAIYALGGNDTVNGNGGDDVLYGQAGNDILNGGAGRDILYGGAGSDVFKFSAAADSATLARSDLIADFELAADKVDLTSLDAVAGGGRTAFKWGGMSTLVAKNSVTFYQDTANGPTIVQADMTGDTVADVVVSMTGLLNLTSAHFML